MPKSEAIFLMPDLRGPEGNAFVLLGRARKALRESGVLEEGQQEFYDEATSGDYKHLLATIMDWFTVVAAKTEYVVINDAVAVLESSSEEDEA